MRIYAFNFFIMIKFMGEHFSVTTGLMIVFYNLTGGESRFLPRELGITLNNQGLERVQNLT